MHLKRSTQSYFYKGFILLFACLYLSVNLSGAWHLILAHDETQSDICIAEEENECHLALVHKDVANGCDHESHFSEEELSCELCSLIKAPFGISDHQPAMSDVAYVVKGLTQLNSIAGPIQPLEAYRLRGPPSIS